MDHDTEDHQTELGSLMLGRRTRVVVVLIGFLVSLAVPIVALGGGSVPTVDGHAVGSLADPAGLGITGALPGDPSTGAATESPTEVPAGVPSDSAGAGLPVIPTPGNLPDGPLGIPGAVLDAYQFAQRSLGAMRPGCHLSWSVLAGIGRIESDHASDGRVDAFGNTLGPILGPRLDGSPGMAAIPDTDHGQLDGDTVWDRAVGPMQFIPSSWRSYGVDGNGDGVANPNNVYDSTITTGLYLCTGGTDLSNPAQLQAAVFRYNHSAAYVDIVLQWARAYLTGVVPTPAAPGPVPPGINGNGGLTFVTDSVALAAAASVAASQPTPLTSTPPATTPSPLPPPATTTTPPPTATAPPTTMSSPPPSPATTPAPPPVTPPATDASPAPPLPPVSPTVTLPGTESSPAPAPPSATPTPSPTTTSPPLAGP